MPVQSKLSKNNAIIEVQKIFRNEDSQYHLVSSKYFKAGKNLGSDRYNFFNVLCFLNTHKQAGWLVCEYALGGGCKLSAALLVCNTASGGTGSLKSHMAQQITPKNNMVSLLKALPQAAKEPIVHGAAMAVVLDIRPLSFTDKKERLLHFADAIFRAGQKAAISDVIDAKSILPCSKRVSAALSKLAEDKRGDYKCMLPSLIEAGGGVTTDGVTLKVQDKQFYDLTIYFI